MKIFILSIITGLSFVCTSCNKGNTKLKEKILPADSVAINYFTGDGKMDTVVSVKIVRDKKTITQLAELIAATNSTVNRSCGYDGSLHFFKNNNVVQDVYFRINDEQCRLFSFVLDGKTAATILSAEAGNLLESFKK